MSYEVFRYCPLRISVTSVIIEIIICITHSTSCEQNKMQTSVVDGGEGKGVSRIMT